MKRIRPPKTGRLPNPDELQIAKDWVFLYREAKKSPNGMLCLNPDAESKKSSGLTAMIRSRCFSCLSVLPHTEPLKTLAKRRPLVSGSCFLLAICSPDKAVKVDRALLPS